MDTKVHITVSFFQHIFFGAEALDLFFSLETKMFVYLYDILFCVIFLSCCISEYFDTVLYCSFSWKFILLI